MHWNFQDFNKYKKQFKKLCQEAEFQESFIEWSTLANIVQCSLWHTCSPLAEIMEGLGPLQLHSSAPVCHLKV